MSQSENSGQCKPGCDRSDPCPSSTLANTTGTSTTILITTTYLPLTRLRPEAGPGPEGSRRRRQRGDAVACGARKKYCASPALLTHSLTHSLTHLLTHLLAYLLCTYYLYDIQMQQEAAACVAAVEDAAANGAELLGCISEGKYGTRYVLSGRVRTATCRDPP